jgi:hypothetical protein
MKKKFLVIAGLALFIGIVGVSAVSANNAWGKYLWNKSTADSILNPLKIGDNLTTPEWKSSLTIASIDWNESVLKNQVVGGTSNSACDPILGRVEVCNAIYGDNGWLGIAQIWAYRGKYGYIAQGVVKVNDTYFDTAYYNTSAWRNLVMCQETGHTFGLDHQDENFANTNLGSCMDYTNDPTGTAGTNGTLNNEHPNLHDYQTMDDIYAHLNSPDDGSGDGGNGGGKGKGKKPAHVGAHIDLNNPSAWGKAIKKDAQGKNSLYEKDLGNGFILITHVTWVGENE